MRRAAWAAVAAAAVSQSDLAVIVAPVLLILPARGEGVGFARLLRSPAIQWLGRISYSLYLVHRPVALALAHAFHGGGLPAPAIAALTVALALPAAAVFHGAWSAGPSRSAAAPAPRPSDDPLPDRPSEGTRG